MRKKILFLVLKLDVGGLEKVVIDMLNSLCERYDVLLCCLEDGGVLIGDVDDRVKVVTLNREPGIKISTVRQVASVIREEKVDVVHTHNSAAHFYGAMASVFFPGLKVVHTKHGRNAPDNRKKVILNYISAVFTDHLVTVSEDARKVCIDIERIPARKISVIENGIDAEHFLPKDWCGASKDKLIIGHVGRLVPEKKQTDLIDVFFEFLKKSSMDAELHIVGGGPLKQELVDYVEAKGLAGKVLLPGVCRDVPSTLSSFDFFAMSSVTEGIPIALLEAMAAGLPCVVTDVGDMGAVVKHEEGGYVVKPRDKEKMLEFWLVLADSLELRKSVGERARARVLDKYSKSKMLRDYEALYES